METYSQLTSQLISTPPVSSLDTINFPTIADAASAGALPLPFAIEDVPYFAGQGDSSISLNVPPSMAVALNLLIAQFDLNAGALPASHPLVQVLHNMEPVGYVFVGIFLHAVIMDGRTRPRWMLAAIPRRHGISALPDEVVYFNLAHPIPWAVLVAVVLADLAMRRNNRVWPARVLHWVEYLIAYFLHAYGPAL
jgi:hypothetical protein